jgi:hypothetical protein
MYLYCTEMGVVGSAPRVKKLGTQLNASTASLNNKLILPRVKSSVYDSTIGLAISGMRSVACNGVARVFTTKFPIGSEAKPTPIVKKVVALDTPIFLVRCILSLT